MLAGILGLIGDFVRVTRCGVLEVLGCVLRGRLGRLECLLPRILDCVGGGGELGLDGRDGSLLGFGLREQRGDEGADAERDGPGDQRRTRRRSLHLRGRVATASVAWLTPSLTLLGSRRRLVGRRNVLIP